MKDELDDEIEENIIPPDRNLDLQGIEDGHFNGKKINSFLYIIPEIIFIACFLSGNFYQKYKQIFIFIPYFVPILIFNCCFFTKRNLLCLNNYLLLTKFLSIEILIFYPIFIIIDSRKEQEDIIFIIIFILGALSGLFSLIYLFLYYYIFQNGLSELKKIYFLYFELIAIIIMHPILIYNVFLFDSLTSISIAAINMLGIFMTFAFEVILFLMNCLFLCLDSDNCCLKIIMAIIKIILYIVVEYFSFIAIIEYNLINEKYLYLSIRIIFMLGSLFFFFIMKYKK